MHLDDKTHGETAVIIKGDVKRYEIDKFQRKFLQVVSIVVKDRNGCITISAIYLLSRHAIKKKQYIIFFKTLHNRFIIAGYYNAKHMHWDALA